MAKTSSSVSFEGAFFKNDPGKTFRQNIRRFTDAAAAEGEAAVKSQMRSGQSSRAPISSNMGRVSDHVRGRTSSLSGERWAVTAVVSVNNRGFSPKQGIALMAAAAEVERQTRAFRKVTSAMRRTRALNEAELLKGIA